VLPTAQVDRVLRIAPTNVQTVEDQDTITLPDVTLPVVRLSAILDFNRTSRREAPEYLHVIVLGFGDDRVAFTVDAVLGEQEVLVKTLGPQLLRLRNISGATILGSGRVVPILNASDLLKSAVQAAALGSTTRETEASEEAKAILVVEDSITSRMLIKNILESAGYEVSTAVDGQEGLGLVKSRPFDLVISDIEMPRMTGFELTERIRSDPQVADVPVMLVTGLESREDREHGMDVGANAYIVKSSFDSSTLLETARRLA
jgi:two-component system, chemotaxis family, sensor kinase CheA